MISDTVHKAILAVAQMSYESWVSILLAALAVLLAIVTLIVAIAGIAIAVVGIWGIRALRKAAEQRAHEAIKETLAEYPNADKFIEIHNAMQELYLRWQRQMSDSKRESEVLHQRSEEANAILDRLSIKQSLGASNVIEGVDKSADIVTGPMSSTYPGEEVDPDDSSIGESITDEGDGHADPR
jgi:hypothetical protein